MSRPTAAPLAYGSATVVSTTVALILLLRPAPGPGVALIGTAALLLGVLVALAVQARRARTAGTGPAPAGPEPAGTGPAAGRPGRGRPGPAEAAAHRPAPVRRRDPAPLGGPSPRR
ncbi:hypothetical protein [Streptomyces sp. CC228A]|uniref:hypothetical protein n=1 Tax=Streptomyces sp. CC228A TaxID=2898186 RepID=UPI001F27F7C3|nr:hypothetical protein [Streptomyces sp. CC228A]